MTTRPNLFGQIQMGVAESPRPATATRDTPFRMLILGDFSDRDSHGAEPDAGRAAGRPIAIMNIAVAVRPFVNLRCVYTRHRDQQCHDKDSHAAISLSSLSPVPAGRDASVGAHRTNAGIPAMPRS